jgi:hypothetical protein
MRRPERGSRTCGFEPEIKCVPEDRRPITDDGFRLVANDQRRTTNDGFPQFVFLIAAIIISNDSQLTKIVKVAVAT